MGASHTFAAVRRDEKPLTQRLLWPLVGLGVVLFGGMGMLFVMFSGHRDHPVPSTPAAVKAVTPPVRSARMQSIDDDPVTTNDKPPAAAPTEKKPAAEPEPKAPETEAAAPATPAAPDVAAAPAAPPVEKKPPGDPYMVPENKPFIDRDMFNAGTNKPKPAVATPATPAAAAATPAAKPAEPAKPPAPPPPPATTVQNDVYVLYSGRKINAVTTIDMGDSYGIKDAGGNFIKIKKADVSNVIKPQP